MRYVSLSAAMLLVVFGVGNGTPTSSGRLQIEREPVVFIEEGEFIRGSDRAAIVRANSLCQADFNSEDPRADFVCRMELFEPEAPRRRIRLRRFGIDRHEVTSGAYRRCVAMGGCSPARLEVRTNGAGYDRYPMAGVTYAQASDYCAFRGGRLPSEAEWERAARGVTARAFPWGDQYNDRLSNHGRASPLIQAQSPWTPSGIDGYRTAAPVGSYPDGASPVGALDMAGNVWEWTADYFDAAAYEDGESVNPVFRSPRPARTVRGGSWRSGGYTHRVSFRIGLPAGAAMSDLGFRCAYDSD